MRVWLGLFVERLWQDARYAVRTLRRSPGFTAVAVLSLALGIGANTAIFSLIHTVMLRMLPVRDPQQLVELMMRYPGEPRSNGGWSWRSLQYLLAHNHVFTGITGAGVNTQAHVRIPHVADPVTAIAERVAPDYFTLLGLRPGQGRLIAPQDDPATPAGAVAVVSVAFWRTHLHADPAAVGARIVVDDVPATIVGIAPPGFEGMQIGQRTGVWLPSVRSPQARFGLVARLRPGVSMEQARAEMAVLFRFTLDEIAAGSKDPLLRRMGMELAPAGSGLARVRDRYSTPLLVLMAVSGVLLLMACVNLAGMLLARGAGRQREFAVRVSLGAGRLRLMQQAWTESLLLSIAGAAAGLALAKVGADVLVRIIASGRRHERFDLAVSLDLPVLLFAAAVAIAAALLFGLAPAWSAFRFAPAPAMRQAGNAAHTPLRRLFERGLIAAQVFSSALLLSAAFLFSGYLSDLRNLDLGFAREHVLLVDLDPSRTGLARAQLAAPYRQLLERLESLPGVRRASISGVTPIQGAGASRFIHAEGFEERADDRRYVSLNWVAPRYFETLATPLLAGRDFAFEDQGRTRVAIVNRALARRYFGAVSPVGKHLTIDGDDQPYEIVGAVADAKYLDLHDAAPATLYLNMFQEGRIFSQFVVRTSVDPASLAGPVRSTVREVLPPATFAWVTTLDGQVDASIVPERLMATLASLFGALGSLLAAVGLYGLLAYTVARRTQEIGVRMALGATGGAISRAVVGDALLTVAAGLALGAPAAWWAARLAGSLIPGLPANGLVPVLLGGAVMLGLALAAAYVPARRAAGVDPIEALRCE